MESRTLAERMTKHRKDRRPPMRMTVRRRGECVSLDRLTGGRQRQRKLPCALWSGPPITDSVRHKLRNQNRGDFPLSMVFLSVHLRMNRNAPSDCLSCIKFSCRLPSCVKSIQTVSMTSDTSFRPTWSSFPSVVSANEVSSRVSGTFLKIANRTATVVIPS